MLNNNHSFFIVVLLLLAASFKFSYAQPFTGSPSVFYTSGNYSDERSSGSLDLYLPLGYNYQWYFSTGLQNLEIKGNDWKYTQKGIPVSAGYYSYPFYFSLHALFNNGDYSYQLSPGFDYSDFGNLAGGEVLYYSGYNTFGLSYTYQNQRGILTADSLSKIEIHQLTGRVSLPITENLYISLRPHFSTTSEGRKLYSLSGKAFYSFSPALTVSIGGFAGKRVYYFDNDSFSLFNQFETQKYQYFIQGNYQLYGNLRAIGGYTKTAFSGYSIQYIFAGLVLPFQY